MQNLKYGIQRILLICLSLLSLNSCNSKYPDDVATSLKLAKSNKAELTKVLEHYIDSDSLKYEAACFLIANMQYHRTEKCIVLSNDYYSYFFKVDSIYNKLFDKKSLKELTNSPRIHDSIRTKLASIYNRLKLPEYIAGKNDVETLSADFLIDNIDVAFEEWKYSPFLRNMSFDEFKEVILPYRTTTESLIFKRSELRDIFQNRFRLDSISNIYDAIAYFNLYIDKMQRINSQIDLMRETGLFDLFIISKEFNCFSNVSWYCNILRACGIPVVFEFTPQWPDRENRHFWAASPDSTGIYIPYSPPQNNLGDDWKTNLKFAGVVYRKTFSKNMNNAFFVKAGSESVPDILNDPFLSDQSFRYKEVIDMELPFIKETPNKLAYLSYITRSGLVSVKPGIINQHDRVVRFNQVPTGLPFVLSYYGDNNILQSIGDPFILEIDRTVSNIAKPLSSNFYSSYKYKLIEGILSCNDSSSNDVSYQVLKPSFKDLISLKILRKYPLKEHLLKLHEKFKDCALVATNQMEDNGKYGKNYDTLYIFQEKLSPYIQHIDIKTNKQYKYFTVASKNMSILNIGHLEYLTLKDNGNPSIDIPIFGLKQKKDNRIFYKISGKPIHGSEDAFDDDVETFSSARFTMIEFSHPINLSSI